MQVPPVGTTRPVHVYNTAQAVSLTETSCNRGTSKQQEQSQQPVILQERSKLFDQLQRYLDSREQPPANIIYYAHQKGAKSSSPRPTHTPKSSGPVYAGSEHSFTSHRQHASNVLRRSHGLRCETLPEPKLELTSRGNLQYDDPNASRPAGDSRTGSGDYLLSQSSFTRPSHASVEGTYNNWTLAKSLHCCHGFGDQDMQNIDNDKRPSTGTYGQHVQDSMSAACVPGDREGVPMYRSSTNNLFCCQGPDTQAREAEPSSARDRSREMHSNDDPAESVKSGLPPIDGRHRVLNFDELNNHVRLLHQQRDLTKQPESPGDVPGDLARQPESPGDVPGVDVEAAVGGEQLVRGTSTRASKYPTHEHREQSHDRSTGETPVERTALARVDASFNETFQAPSGITFNVKVLDTSDPSLFRRCGICQKLFRSTQAYSEHLENSHPLLSCPHCGAARFHTQSGLSKHIIVMHQDKMNNTYVCKVCKQKRLTAKGLLRHVCKQKRK